jgi:RNA polymerase sigma-70 factor (ECF subfamily)
MVRAAQGGDRQAFARLHARYAPMIHAIVLARVPWADAEDLVQNVFLNAMGKLSSLARPEQFGGWLSAIARNQVTDYHRSRKHSTEEAEQEPRAPGSSSDRLEANTALAAIRALPEAYRETLLMRLCEGLSGPEIADRTGLDPDSVRVNLHRGLKLLREKLGWEK